MDEPNPGPTDLGHGCGRSPRADRQAPLVSELMDAASEMTPPAQMALLLTRAAMHKGDLDAILLTWQTFLANEVITLPGPEGWQYMSVVTGMLAMIAGPAVRALPDPEDYLRRVQEEVDRIDGT